MKLRALQRFGDTNQVRDAGDVYDEPNEAVAQARIKAGLAKAAGKSEDVTDAPDVETATASTASTETATFKGKGRGKKPR